MDWKKIEPTQTDMWDFEKAKTLSGVLTKVKHDVGPNESTIYTVKSMDGKLYSFWGSTLLDDRLGAVELGDEIKVEYLGKVKSEKTGREYRNYDVFSRSEKVDADEVPSDLSAADKEMPF